MIWLYGFGSFARHDSGPELANRKDIGIEMELSRFYNEAKQILIENREFLDKVAKALLEKRTLLRSDIAVTVILLILIKKKNSPLVKYNTMEE